MCPRQWQKNLTLFLTSGGRNAGSLGLNFVYSVERRNQGEAEEGEGRKMKCVHVCVCVCVRVCVCVLCACVYFPSFCSPLQVRQAVWNQLLRWPLWPLLLHGCCRCCLQPVTPGCLCFCRYPISTLLSIPILWVNATLTYIFSYFSYHCSKWASLVAQ